MQNDKKRKIQLPDSSFTKATHPGGSGIRKLPNQGMGNLPQL